MDKIFMVYADFSLDSSKAAEFHNNIAFNFNITDWWNHIPGLYFIKTKLSLHEVSFGIRNSFGEDRLIIAEIHPDQVDGNLPPEAWQWFSK